MTSRRDRPAWSKTAAARHALRDLIYRNNRFVVSRRNEVAKHDDEVGGFPDELRVSVVSFPLDRACLERRSLPIDPHLDVEDLGLGHVRPTGDWADADVDTSPALWVLKQEARAAVVDRILERLREAAEFEPHLVCLPELMFPYHGSDAGSDPQAREFLEAAQGVFGSPHPYILAGSFHSRLTGRNIAVFACPERMRPEEGRGAPRYRYFLHKKLVAARRVGEDISVPADRPVRHYTTAIGRISIAVCLDLYDASQALHLISMNATGSHENVEILLVPSFNMGEVVKAQIACEQLSALMRNVIVFSHASFEDSAQKVFVCGSEATCITHGADSVGGVANFAISRMQLEQSRGERPLPQWFRWLFLGLPGTLPGPDGPLEFGEPESVAERIADRLTGQEISEVQLSEDGTRVELILSDMGRVSFELDLDETTGEASLEFVDESGDDQ